MRVGSVVLHCHCHVLCRGDVSAVLERLVALLCIEEWLESLAACVVWLYFCVARYRGDDDCIVFRSVPCFNTPREAYYGVIRSRSGPS